MRLGGLMQPLVNNEKFLKILSYIDKQKLFEVQGLSDSSKSYLLSSIYEETKGSLVVIADNDIEAKNIYEDLNLFCTNVFYLPSKEMVFYNVDAISGDLRWERLKVIKEILNKKKKIIVTTVEAFVPYYTPIKLYKSHKIKIKLEQQIELKELAKVLLEAGYERVDMVEGKGEFALRGGILDVYPADSIYPYRIELFGDEIDSIRTFNVTSQRSIDKVKSIDIFPAKEIITDDSIIEEAIDRISKELDEVSKNIKDIERKSKLRQTVNKNLETLRETRTFETIDSYLPLIYEEKETLFDYLKDYTYVIDSKVRCKGKIDSTYLEFSENSSIFLERGDILPSQVKLAIDKEELIDCITANANLVLEEKIGRAHV